MMFASLVKKQSGPEPDNPNYMPGFTPVSIITNAVEGPTGFFTGYTGCPYTTGLYMPIDGEIGFRIFSGTDSLVNIFLSPGGTKGLGLTASEGAMYAYKNPGNESWEKIADIEDGAWITIRRVSNDVLNYYKSTDGVTFQNLDYFGISNRLGGFVPEDKLGIRGRIDITMSHLQGRGLLAI